MILYQGSNAIIEKIDLSLCKPYKDFGKGFYTTPLQNQAFEMAKRTVAIFGGNPAVTAFEVDDNILSLNNINVKNFGIKASKDWALFIRNNRDRFFQDINNPLCNIDNKYDIVFGPVANDTLVNLIRQYNDELIDLESLVKKMEYRKLSLQYSFHTVKAISFLKRIWYMNIQKHLLEGIIKDIIFFEAKNTGKNIDILMKDFYSSETFDKLSNYETGLYRESPWYVYELYQIEKQNGKLIQTEV